MAAQRGVARRVLELAARPAGRPFSQRTGAAAPTAEQLAEKIRAQKRQQRKTPLQEIPKDPVRRRILEFAQLTQQLQRVHPNVLAKALKRGILFQNKEMVVINKPYGLPVHGGPGVKMCISDVLPILAKMLDGMKAEPLHLCHRLDKETTGVMVLARDQDAAHRIQELFRLRQVEKRYWAICIGMPKPTEGLVDIPIVEKEVEGNQPHYKMTLAPNYRLSQENGEMIRVRRQSEAHMAVTRYKVLSSASSCCLLELQPATGVKHQLRVHVAYGLGCPILGDHKYSHWSKLAPQKLPQSALKRLGLEQVKARHLPLHLHACQLTLPEGSGSEAEKIHLVCKLPLFFARSLQRLKLDFPELGKN